MGRFGGSIGAIRVTGRPRRAITIASPRST
jgi:hypothetical protein